MDENAATHRESWEQRYAGDDYIFGTEPSTLLSEHQELFCSGQRALMIADGEGRNGVFLARLGLEVTSFDLSANGLAKAKRLAERAGVTLKLVECDANDWDWNAAQYDVIVGIFFQFATPPERAAYFAGIVQALKPGGLVLLRGYTAKQAEYRTGGPSDPAHFYSAEMLREAFPDFDILRAEEREVELQEGTRHRGMSAFVDFIAAKRR
jgi:cyclopropane fatty-acyl-phospholipid synthase-like methyltransferase